MVRFLLMLLIFIISFSFGFEIRTGEYEDKVRIVLDGVKNADIVTVSNNLILKVSEKYKNSNFKLNNSSIKEIEIYTNEEKNSSLIYITLQEGLSYKYFSLSNPDRFVIDIMKVSTVKNQIQKTKKKRLSS